MPLSPFASATTTAQGLSNLVLVTPQDTVGYQPQNAPNPDGSPNTAPLQPTLLFHYEGEQSLVIESDITDHFIEDNTAIQDHIALKPEIVNVHGFIGELNDVVPKSLASLKAAANKLTAVSAFIPSLSITAINAFNQAVQAYAVVQNVAAAATSAFNQLSGTSSKTQTKQQIMLQQFYGYWATRTLFTVQTPWGVFTDMAIKSIRAIQDGDTRMISDFEVSFKKMRFTNTVALGGTAIKLDQSGRAKNQSGSLVDFGIGSTGPDTAFTLTG